MTRRDTIDSLFTRKSEPPGPSVVVDKERVRTGAISAMGTSLKELTEGARAAARLQEQFDAGAAVIDLDPLAVDGSMVSDRLTVEIDPSFDALMESMRSSGQQVPILVRPHPVTRERFQVAYGHRRLRAAVKLGIKIKAIVRPLTDGELVVAQGKENLDRHDLSYIEKALFARRLEDQGFERAVIMAALSTDKGDLSRYISVARMIPEPLLQAIGPAGKAGRARWIALAERLGQSRADKIVQETLESAAFRELGSDARFALLFQALEKPTRKPAPKSRVWTNRAGRKAARIESRPDRTVLTIDEGAVPAFAAYLVDQLDDLYAQFVLTKREEGDNPA
jgi:ParB family transcriptional regulator, chromosome partitioning protein